MSDPLGETPAECAARLAARFAADIPVATRRTQGQFFTPLEVARFMAALAAPGPSVRRLLDPGAGTGILACALCEALPPGAGPAHLDAYELDPALHPICHTALAYAQRWLAERGIPLTFTVHATDYVIENSPALTPTMFGNPTAGNYDIAVANPPYFKLQKRDPRALAAAAVVHGQPNIYALFLAITASLLAPGGVMVTITPRSFATGQYFRRFRRHLFAAVTPEALHLFQSRKAAFRADAVLQENLILRARKAAPSPASTVAVSASWGTSDLAHRPIRELPLQSVVDLGSRNVILNIPADAQDDAVMSFVRGWADTLHDLGLEASTGRVVAFRARRFLLPAPDSEPGVAPLLWLQNVGHMAVRWPIGAGTKAQYIRDTPASRTVLIRNSTYVLLRRFSAKEERRRLTAAPLLAGELPGASLGLENHLNYVHRPGGHLDDDEAIGLAALLGSALLDRYFRVSNGNTQVNATELRALPLPPLRSLAALGGEIRRHAKAPDDIEILIGDVLKIPPPLRTLHGDTDGEA